MYGDIEIKCRTMLVVLICPRELNSRVATSEGQSDVAKRLNLGQELSGGGGTP
jgi:hypothetical protein